jgi:beta-mannosidase
MNLLRVHAHIDHPTFYDAADELGILLWQDFPLQWLYRRSILGEAIRQARQMVDLLGNHPSVAVWCMHNEPVFMTDTADTHPWTAVRLSVSLFIWNWNREVLDRRLQREVRALDRSRPTISNSGQFAVPGWTGGTDSHFYYGWYPVFGQLRGFDWIRQRVPGNIRFVTEFGAQSFPQRESCEKFMAANVEEIDWEHLREHHSFQPEIMALWYDWRASGSLDELIETSQRYQAEVNRFYIDRLRLSKYHPTGGIVAFMFNDSNPAVQWSIVDYWRVTKASYWAMRDAFRPQYAWALLDADEYTPGEELTVPIYVVNDGREAVDYQLDVEVLDDHGHLYARARAEGELDPDCLPEVATILDWTTEQPGDYYLRIEFQSCGKKLSNIYDIRVRRFERANGKR